MSSRICFGISKEFKDAETSLPAGKGRVEMTSTTLMQQARQSGST